MATFKVNYSLKGYNDFLLVSVYVFLLFLKSGLCLFKNLFIICYVSQSGLPKGILQNKIKSIFDKKVPILNKAITKYFL